MLKHNQDTAAIEFARQMHEAMCHRERERQKSVEDLSALVRRIEVSTRRTHREVSERIALEAGVDLEPIYEELVTRREARRSDVTKTIESLLPQLAEQARQVRERRLQLRREYLRGLTPRPTAAGGSELLKFAGPSFWTSLAQPAVHYGDWEVPSWRTPDRGLQEASASFDATYAETPVYMFGRIYTDNGDDSNTSQAYTEHSVWFPWGGALCPPFTACPRRSFAVSSIEIDLSGTAVGLEMMGDCFWDGWLRVCPNPAYVPVFVLLTVTIAQLVRGASLEWTPIDRHILASARYGDAFAIEVETGLERFPCDFVLRGSDSLGSDGVEGLINVIVTLRVEVDAAGPDGRALVDFEEPDGFRLGCVTLRGEYL